MTRLLRDCCLHLYSCPTNQAPSTHRPESRSIQQLTLGSRWCPAGQSPWQKPPSWPVLWIQDSDVVGMRNLDANDSHNRNGICAYTELIGLWHCSSLLVHVVPFYLCYKCGRCLDLDPSSQKCETDMGVFFGLQIRNENQTTKLLFRLKVIPKPCAYFVDDTRIFGNVWITSFRSRDTCC